MSNYGDELRDSEATEALTKLDDKLIEVGEESGRQSAKERMERVERKTSRAAQAAVAISLLVALFSLLLAGWNTLSIAHNEAQNAITQDGLESLKAANERLEARGLPKIPLPREGESINADALAAAAAAILKDDIRDDPNFRGPQGRPGDPCVPQVPGCTGPAGPSGQNGSEGQQGPMGAQGPGPTDEQILAGVSAYCTADPTKCQGAKGEKGDQGVPGPIGPQGSAGPPGIVCPGGMAPVVKGYPDLEGDYAVVCRPE